MSEKAPETGPRPPSGSIDRGRDAGGHRPTPQDDNNNDNTTIVVVGYVTPRTRPTCVIKRAGDYDTIARETETFATVPYREVSILIRKYLIPVIYNNIIIRVIYRVF